MIHSQKSDTLLNSVKQVQAIYQKRDFIITHILFDGEFECLRKQVQEIYQKRGFIITHILFDGEFEFLCGALSTINITLNAVPNDEHTPEVERAIRTLKERTRCVYNTLLFTLMPYRLIIEMVYCSNFWLNYFPYPGGFSDVLSPRAIVTGMSFDFLRHCQLELGT
jgi:hypothetical protein